MGTKTLVRLLIVLAVGLAAAALVYFFGSSHGVEAPAPTTAKKKIFSDFPINDVSSFTITGKDGSVEIKKGAATWEVGAREGYPASTDTITKLLRTVWDLNIIQPVTIGRAQYGRLSLLDPKEAPTPEEAATIMAFKGAEDKELASLWLGKIYEKSENRPNPFGGGMATSEAGRYVKTGDSFSVYLVGVTLNEAVLDATTWLDKSFFAVTKVKRIAIKSSKPEQDWTLTRESDSADFVLEGATEAEVLDQAKVSSMKSAFTNPQFEDVLVGEELKKSPSDQASFVITTFEGFTYEISTGTKNDLNELALSVKVSGEFVKERKPGEEESEEEKKKLDEEFTTNLASLQKKLAGEQKLAGHVYKVRSYLVDSIIKERSELLVEKKEEAADGATPPAGTEVAPGVTLPGLP